MKPDNLGSNWQQDLEFSAIWNMSFAIFQISFRGVHFNYPARKDVPILRGYNFISIISLSNFNFCQNRYISNYWSDWTWMLLLAARLRWWVSFIFTLLASEFWGYDSVLELCMTKYPFCDVNDDYFMSRSDPQAVASLLVSSLYRGSTTRTPARSF